MLRKTRIETNDLVERICCGLINENAAGMDMAAAAAAPGPDSEEAVIS